MKNRNFLIVLVIYIAGVLAVAFSGIAGDGSDGARAEALRYFRIQDIETGRSFFLHGIIPATLNRIISILFLALLIMSGLYERFSVKLARHAGSSMPAMIFSFLVILLSLSLLRLPLAIYGGFFRDRIFNVSSIGFPLWLARYSGGILISAAVTALTLGLLAFLIRKTKRYFMYIPLVFFALTIAFTVLYPRVITPLFYETSKVEDPVLNERIREMCREARIEVGDIFVLHKSAYAMVANAYLTGMGSQRRIYLYDTLLTRFSTNEILSILAHEICHYREEHMLIGISLGAMGIFLLFPFVRRLSRVLWGKGLEDLAETRRHPELIFLLGMVMFFASPLENSVSRVMERRADRYSLELTRDPATCVAMEVNLARMNKSNILPGPFFSWFYGSHPTVLERIRTAEEYGR